MWRTDKPENIGSYIVIIPEIIGPIQDPFPQRVTGSVTKAWFDGERFNLLQRGFMHNYSSSCEVGQCVWTFDPDIFYNGWGENGPCLIAKEK